VRLGATALVLLALGAGLEARAQTISGTVFDDRDADGIQDAGEPGIAGVEVVLYGKTNPGGVTVDQTVVTASDGTYSFSPGDGFYLVMPVDPAGWRLGPARADGFVPGPGYVAPVGQPRFAKLDHAIDHLRAGVLRYAAMGDSIAYNWASCPSIFNPPPAFNYSRVLTERLQHVAVKGEYTDDLLVDDGATDHNNAFAVIGDQPELITISMIGNDLLDVDYPSPTQAQVNAAAAEVLDSRQNFQEMLSSAISQIPGADVALNTLYDNEAQSCNTTDFHRVWVPIVDRVLREVAWGQSRRVSMNEIFPEFAHQDQLLACTGFTGKICNGFADGIHPNEAGYAIVLEKVWEGIGGVILGPVMASSVPNSILQLNPVERHSLAGVDFGYLRRVRRVLPTTWQTLGGAAVQSPDAALDDQDAGAAARITVDAVGKEFRLAGFPDWLDEVQIVKAIAGVRYRTTGAFPDNAYRMEASIGGQFRPPPAHDFSSTDWNYYTPIVGAGGPNQPPGDLYPDTSLTKVLVVPNVPSYREASATLTKNPTLPGGAGEYEWPPVTRQELGTTEVRVAVTSADTPCTAPCSDIELDAAWIDLYGWEKPRPPEVENVEILRLGDGTIEISFDPVAGATRYNVYFGRLGVLRTGVYDHGSGAPAGPLCDATTQSAGGSRLKIVVAPGQQPAVDTDVLVTAHVDDVESPSGYDSDATEIDRSQSICD
jgi:lysophospholipase L1-like esterase